jgi:hypothetical protein
MGKPMSDTGGSVAEHSSLAEALHGFQGEDIKLHKGETAKVKTKSGAEYSYRYIGLDTIMEVIQPLLTKHELIWTAFPDHLSSGAPSLHYELMHSTTQQKVEGEKKRRTTPCPSRSGTTQG